MFETKLLKRMILMVSMLGMILLSMPGVSSAEDVWCYSSHGHSYYLSSDSIRVHHDGGITYTVDGVVVLDSDGSFVRPLMYGFDSDNDIMVGSVFNRAFGKWEYCGRVSKDPNMNAVWQAMKPYMKQKGIYYSDSWE